MKNGTILQVLQGQVSIHQLAVEKLKKAAEVLLDTRGELLPDKEEIQKMLGKKSNCMFNFVLPYTVLVSLPSIFMVPRCMHFTIVL